MLILRLMIIEVKCTHTSFVGSCQQSGAKVTRYAMKQSICRAHLNKTEQMMLCHLLSQSIVLCKHSTQNAFEPALLQMTLLNKAVWRELTRVART